ncbi:MAG: DNA topoisomerase I, partial [Spirochaetales bacterium]|nr:DNA topoisomerase I [Spirochaetales bacterium]
MADKKVIIVESPTKARTIRRFLGSDCTVVASNGHIRTLPKNDLCIDVKNGYKPKYIIDETKEKVISQIKSELKGADELILATDEDREGESISWHLVEVLKPKMPTRRMVFHEITKKAILEAFAGGRDLDMNLVHAQEARRILDRLFGYTISPVLWSKLSNKSLSAGRVQSPGLRLVVDRERTRITFQKSEYWDLRASFREGFFASIDTVNGLRVANGKDFDSETGKYMGSSKVLLLSKEAAKALVDSLKDSDFTISDVKEKQVTQRPAPPFITSTLQQEGNRKLHMSAKDTMRIAQSLYENGFITYMRTDSPTLSQEGIRAAREAALAL